MLKAAIEQLLGENAWYALKETTSISVWRKHLQKVLQAIRVAFRQTVKVRDASLAAVVEDNLARGEHAIGVATDIDGLLSAFSATLLRQIFIQLGTVPRRRPGGKVTLDKKFWELDAFRSVQYVQSVEQLENEFLSRQQQEIGPSAQASLRLAHRQSSSELSYAEWCREREA